MSNNAHPYLYKLVKENISLLSKKDHQSYDRPAIATLSFDGSKRSLKIAFGNITSFRELREYGLINKMQNILHAISCLYEQFIPVSEIIVGNGDDVLIQIKNSTSNGTEHVLYLDIRPVLEKIACVHSRKMESGGSDSTASTIDEKLSNGQTRPNYRHGLAILLVSVVVVAAAFMKLFNK